MPPKSKKRATTKKQLPKTRPGPKKPEAKKLEFEHGWLQLKELQSIIAFRCYESLDPQGMKKPEQEEKLYALYHGTETKDSIGMAEKFFLGIEMFEGIYEEVTDEVSGESYRVMKRIFHCSENVYKCSEDIPDAINMTNLTANTSTDRANLTGRAILQAAKRVEAVGRKVLAFVMKSSKYSDPNFKVSGEGWEDYLKYCRYMMLFKEKGDKAINVDSDDDGEEGDDDDDETSANKQVAEEDSKVPAAMTEDEIQETVKAWSGYGTFKGYMAWALWGHIPMPGLEDFQATKFCVSDASETVSGGRKATRKKVAEKESKIRSNQAGRGVSVADEVTLRDVKAKELHAQSFARSVEQQDYELQIKALEKKIEAANTEIYQWSPMVTERQADIFRNGLTDHDHWYATFFPYKMWHDANEKKRVALEKIDAIYALLEREAEEARVAKKRKAEAEAAAAAAAVAPIVADDATSIPTTIDVEK
jgi:hypothetical protein